MLSGVLSEKRSARQAASPPAFSTARSNHTAARGCWDAPPPVRVDNGESILHSSQLERRWNERMEEEPCDASSLSAAARRANVDNQRTQAFKGCLQKHLS